MIMRHGYNSCSILQNNLKMQEIKKVGPYIKDPLFALTFSERLLNLRHHSHVGRGDVITL